jgi:hypothetical protein
MLDLDVPICKQAMDITKVLPVRVLTKKSYPCGCPNAANVTWNAFTKLLRNKLDSDRFRSSNTRGNTQSTIL